MISHSTLDIGRIRSYFLLLGAALSVLLGLWACSVESTPGAGDTNLRFDKIADSLAKAGYDRLDISVAGPGLNGSLELYEGAVSPVTPVPMPDSVGDSYLVTIKAFDDQKPGQVFQKVYTIMGGKVIGDVISVIPGDPGPVVTDPDPNDSTPPPATVTINPGTLGLAVGGDTATLKAVILPVKAKQNVTWKSGNEAVATVDASGLVRSGAAGTATIYAQAVADTGKRASIEVTVSQPVAVEKVELDPPTLRLFTGGPVAALQASVLPSGSPLLLNWVSSNPAVATVGADGMVKGLAAGTAMISAHSKGDASKSDTCVVTVVKDAPILDVGEDISVEVGATVMFTLTVTQEFGGIMEYRWSLDADTAWDEIAATLPATLSRKYSVAGDVYAHFYVKDGEGNVVQAKRLIRVGSAAPLVVIETPEDGDTVGTTPLTVTYKVNNVSLSKSVALIEGRNRIGADTVINGVRGFDSITVFLNSKVPEVAITSPVDGFVTSQSVIDVAWKVDNQAQTTRLKDTLRVEGENTVTRTFTNSAGVIGSKSIKVILDTKKPVVLITSPAPGTITRSGVIDVAWKVDDVVQTVRLKDTLKVEGENQIKREFTDAAGNKGADSVKVTLDSQAPEVAITSPLPGTFTKNGIIDVAWTVDNVAQTTRLKDTLKVEGENIIKREFTDAAGSKGSASVTVTLDTQAPVVAITSPASGAKVAANPVPVIWTVDAESQTTLTSETMSAGDGTKTIARSFTDKAGNTGTKSITVVMDLVKPLTPVMNATGTTVSPTNAATVTWKWTSGGAGGNGSFRYWMNSATVPTTPAPTTVAVAQAAVASLAEGTNTLYVQEGDSEGNWSPIGSQAIVIDRTPPTAIVFDGGATQAVAAAAYSVSVAVTDASSGLASVAVAGASDGNGAMALNTTSGKWTKAVTLKPGLNTLTVTATDKAGNVRTGSAAVTYNQPVVTISSPEPGFVTSNPSVTISYTVSNANGSKTYTPPAMTVVGINTFTTQEAGAANATIQIHYQPKVVFVRKGASAGGDGTSWDKSYADLRVALESPRGKISGNKLWISEGVYVDTDLTQGGSFEVAAGVSLYGGFPATGRPSTEAGRNQSATGPKTQISINPEADFAGLITVAGPATLDGLSFYQNKIGPGAVHLGDASSAGTRAFTVKACQFKSTGGRVGSIFSTNNSNVTMDSCTFEGANTLGSMIYVSGASLKITRSRMQSNQCLNIATLDGGSMEFTSSTITNNIAVFAEGEPPDIVIESGTLLKHAGVVTDVPSLLQVPVTP